jgi:hypothetical protein
MPVPAAIDLAVAEVRPFEDQAVKVLPCRPTISCTADIVPPGTVEIEAGYAARYVRPAGFVHAEPLLFKLTLVPWLQAQVGSNGYVAQTGSVARAIRYDDIWFTLKAHLVDQVSGSAIPSIAVSAAMSVPSFGPASDFPFAYDASFWGYVSKDLGRVHLDLNGGLNEWQFDLPVRVSQGFVTAAATITLPLHLGAMIEGYGFSDAGAVAPGDAGLLTAVSYSPSPSINIDVGEDTSFIPSTRRMTLFVGMTFIAARLWGREAPAVEVGAKHPAPRLPAPPPPEVDGAAALANTRAP